jgi:UDP-N-acetyl-D-mannosaminuronate dehydrogenase
MRTVYVIGLGYIGLPITVMFATHSLIVWVVINDGLISKLTYGFIHIY